MGNVKVLNIHYIVQLCQTAFFVKAFHIIDLLNPHQNSTPPLFYSLLPLCIITEFVNNQRDGGQVPTKVKDHIPVKDGYEWVSCITLTLLKKLRDDIGLGDGDGELGQEALKRAYKYAMEANKDLLCVKLDSVEDDLITFYQGYLACLKDKRNLKG